MILGKVMMVQNSSPIGSVEYLISKKIMLLRGEIKNYTLTRFIDEIGVSRTSMVRYMKNIGIQRFSRFKAVMYDECMRTYIDLKKLQTIIQEDTFSKEAETLAVNLKNAKRVLILGDGHRYSLIGFQKVLTYLGIDTEIPVYLGSEEEIILKSKLTKDDLIIVVSLHESYQSFLENRSMFYLDGTYLDIETVTEIGFIGISEVSPYEKLKFEITLQQNMIDIVIHDLIKVVQDAIFSIVQDSNIEEYF